MSYMPVHLDPVHSEMQGLLDRIFQSAGPSEFKLPSSPSFITRDPTSVPRSVTTVMAAGTPPAPPTGVPVTQSPLPTIDYAYTLGPNPLLSSEPYVPHRSIRDWLRDLDLFIVTVTTNQRTCYLICFLSIPALSPVSPWPIVLGLDFLTERDCTIYIRHKRLVIGSPISPTATPAPSDDLDLAYNTVLSTAALEPTHLKDVLPAPTDDLDLAYNTVLSTAALEPTHLNDVLSSPSTVGPVAHKQLSDLASFSVLFSWSTDTISRTRIVEQTIDTGDARPIWQPPRRIPVRYRDEVDKLLDELLRAKFIRPSSSPWASPIALVPKKDSSRRPCIDYRRLNAVTVRDSFPLPRLYDTIDALGQAVWFSTLDLKSGY
ncbi:hypothetical protein SprV_0301158400 [Sparganum proliferum]